MNEKNVIKITPDEEFVGKLIEFAEQMAIVIAKSSKDFDQSILPVAQITAHYISLIVHTIFSKIVPLPGNFIYLIPSLWQRIEHDIQENTTLDKKFIKKARKALSDIFSKIEKEDF